MATKSVEIAICDLTKVVLGLQSKVISLEKTVLNQNNLIKKLVSNNESCLASTKNVNVNVEEGRSSKQSTSDPRVRAKLAISVPARSEKDNSTKSSARSEASTMAESTRTSSRQSTPASPNTSAQAAQRDLLNDAHTSYAQRDVSENLTSSIHGNQNQSENSEGGWVNVKPRNSRRAALANVRNTTGVVEDNRSAQTLSAYSNYTEVSTKTYSILKGSNTSILRIKAVERKKYLHIWRLLTETTEDNLIEYIRELLGKDCYIKVDKINHKSERGYSSFRICVSEDNYEKLCNPNIWPKDAEFSEWLFFRRATKKPQH